ncbi:MAG: alpha-2-macroglobulin family protein [bacterium]
MRKTFSGLFLKMALPMCTISLLSLMIPVFLMIPGSPAMAQPGRGVEVTLPDSETFTITRIEPSLKDRSVTVTFTRSCDQKGLRDALRIFPPVALHWYQSYTTGNELHLRGDFKAGQEYVITFNRKVFCNGLYIESLHSFKMPDLDPSIDFAEEGSVIERDSRQMLHAEITNIRELLFQGLSLPPILLPFVLPRNRNSIAFDTLKEEILREHERLTALLAGIPPLENFMGDPVESRQLFFPGKERNKKETFSIPLSFRKNKEKGAITLVSLSGREDNLKAVTPLWLFRITDLGLTYKISDDSMLIWATSLSTGRHLGGVSFLALVDNRESVVHLGRTDKDGLLLIRNQEPARHVSLATGGVLEKPLFLSAVTHLIAASPADSTYIDIHQRGNIRADWLNQAKEKKAGKRFIKGHVFTERGVYRPGDTVHFKGTVREYREGVIIPPAGLKPSFEIMNAKDEKVYEKELDLSTFGTAADSFEIKSFFPLGTYTITMKFPGQPGDSASRTFEVQEFRPPRHFVEVQCKHERRPDDRYVNLDRESEMLDCTISGIYYAGGPVKHGKARWKIYYKSTSFQPEGYRDFTFGHIIDHRKELLESGEAMLDEKGKLGLKVPLSKDVLAGLYAIEVVATVVDFDGRAASDTGAFQVEPEYLVGLSSHRQEVEAGESDTLKIIVIDRKGKRVMSGKVAAEVMRRSYSYVRKRNDFGDVQWHWTEVWRKEISTTLPLEEGRALFDFEFINGGEYLLKFTYQQEDGKSSVSSTRYEVKGYFYGYEYENRSRNFEKLTLLPEKTLCSPGETVRLFLKPHKKVVSFLMTIERDTLLEYRIITLRPGQTFLDLPLKDSFMPNIYVSFLGIVARDDFPVYGGQFDDGAPAFLYGAANIEVRKETEHLKVFIQENTHHLKAEPGSEVTLDLLVTDSRGRGVAGELAIGVVDESVLALTMFETPSLETLARFTFPLSVFTGEERADLIRQTPFTMMGNEQLTGGGGIDKSPEAVPTKIRKDFNPVAYFHPSVYTDEAGRAAISFTLPDTMTTYRVYAVALDKGCRFASAQTGLLVVKDFYLEPGLPRFFTRGDRFTFSVSAFNKKDQSSTVFLSLGENPLIRMIAGNLTSPLGAFDRVLLPVQGEVVRPGEAELSFSASFAEQGDAVKIKLPVHSGYLSWNDLVFGTVRGKESLHYTFPEGTDRIDWQNLSPDEVEVVLTLSGSPFLRMSKGLRYLLTYPYGCVEQTSSGVLPLAALKGLIQEGLIPDISIEETDKFLKAGVERLLSMQISSGGFGYWPGDHHASRWGTLYAASALTQAVRAGFSIPENGLAKTMQYVREELKKEGKLPQERFHDPGFPGFALYILALNKSLDHDLFHQIYRDLEKMPREGALFTLLAARITGYIPEGKLIDQTRTVIERTWDPKRPDIFYARYREPAIALLAAKAILPQDPSSGRLARQLLSGLNKKGTWTSTSDTGWSLLALGEYFRDSSFTEGPSKVTLSQGGEPEVSLTLDSKVHLTHKLRAESFLKDPTLTLTTDSSTDLVYLLSLTFPRVDYAREGYSRGFRIHKRIENTDGSKSIAVGDVVKVILDIEVEKNSYTFLVLDDPLPAGLVAINSALRTEEQPAGYNRMGADESHWIDWDFEGGFYRFIANYFEIRDDRVLAFKNSSWPGRFRYSYYARAVCEGEFIMPSTKIQLMYEPDIAAYTPVGKLTIEPGK